MEYVEFKNFLFLHDDSEEIYNTLVKTVKPEALDTLYEKYIKDDTIDEDLKYDRVEYYLEMQDKKFEKNDIYSSDPYIQYSRSIRKIKELPEEEKEKLFNKYAEISKKLEEKNNQFKKIKKTYEDIIFIRLRKVGFKSTINRRENLKNGIEFLKNFKNKNEKVYIDIAVLELIYEAENIIDILMSQYLKFVIYTVRIEFVKKFGTKYRSLELMDAIQAGNIGLRKAVEKYDLNRGKFTTCAYQWIRQAISRTIQEEADMVTRPVYIYERYTKFKTIKDRFINENFREPTEEELSKISGFSIKSIRELEQISEDFVSLDQPIGDGDTKLEDMIEDESDIDQGFMPDASIVNKKHIYWLFENTKKFKPNEKLVIILRTGLDMEYIPFDEFEKIFKNKLDGEAIIKKYETLCKPREVYTLEQVGEELGVTRERIRQIQKRCLKKLRNTDEKWNKKDSKKHEEQKNKVVENKINEIKELESSKTGLIDRLKEKYDELDRYALGRHGMATTIHRNNYPGEFEFTVEEIEKTMKYFEGKSSRIPYYLKFYYEYEKVKKELCNFYSYLIANFINTKSKKGYNFNEIDIDRLMSEGLRAINMAIDKYVKNKKADALTPIVSRYVNTYLSNELRNQKKEKQKTLKKND